MSTGQTVRLAGPSQRQLAHRLIDAAPQNLRNRGHCASEGGPRSCANSDPALTITMMEHRMAKRQLAPRGPRIKTCAHCGSSFPKDPRNTWAYWSKAKYCSQRCSADAWSEQAAKNRPPEAEVFAKWVDRSGECWLWQGARDANGYGAFSFAGRTRRAHVVSLILDGRPPAPGQYACHHCDNPSCVRPSHLYPGSPLDNMRDAKERGRMRKGERVHFARLREHEVRAIRESSQAIPELARLYGVSPANIRLILNRKTWKHIP